MRSDSHPLRWRFQILAAIYAVLGGAIGATLLFNGLSAGGIVLGLVVTILLITATGLRSGSAAVAGVVAAYSLAFMLLTWPLLFLAAGALWGSWE